MVFSVPIIIKLDNGGYHAFSPTLKRLHAPYDTREEALQNARDVAIIYIKSLIKHVHPNPLGITAKREKSIFKRCFRSQTHEYTQDLLVAAIYNLLKMSGIKL